MRRYKPEYDAILAKGIMAISASGEYVLHSEAQAEIERLQAEVERLKDASECGLTIMTAFACVTEGSPVARETTVREIGERLESIRDTAHNNAIEAAANMFGGESNHQMAIRECIRSLLR